LTATFAVSNVSSNYLDKKLVRKDLISECAEESSGVNMMPVNKNAMYDLYL
jgi:hypothetical protein